MTDADGNDSDGHGEGQPHKLADHLQELVDRATVAQAQAAARTAEATARSAEATADADTVVARLALAKSFVPDLSAVKPSTLDVKPSTPSFGSLLTFAALTKIAGRVAEEVHAALPRPEDVSAVLVTSDLDLATADATYVEVDTGLVHVLEATRQLLHDLEHPQEPATDDKRPLDLTRRPPGKAVGAIAGAVTGLAAAAIAGGPAAPLVLAGEAVAAALPGLLSLLGTDRTLLAGTIDASDTATTAAVAGALKKGHASLVVVHDDFRLLPDQGLLLRANELAAGRVQLTTWELTLTNAKSAADRQLAELQAAKPPDAGKIAAAAEASTRAAAGLLLVKTLGTTIDAFTAAIHAVPAGAKRSSFATAVLHGDLHGEKRRFSHVVFAKANAGETDEEISHRRLEFWKDNTFSSVADITVTYLLLETARSSIVAAGNVTGAVHAHGNVGGKPKVAPPELVE
jgi:hypothetical protein